MEAKAKGKSLGIVLILCFFFLALLLFNWGSLLTLIFFYLKSLQFATHSSLLIILLFNVIILMAYSSGMHFYEKNFSQE